MNEEWIFKWNRVENRESDMSVLNIYIYIYMTFRGNNKKWMNNEYLNEIELRIKNRMWVFWIYIWHLEEIIKKWMNNEYLNEIELRIENRMWVFWKVIS